MVSPRLSNSAGETTNEIGTPGRTPVSDPILALEPSISTIPRLPSFPVQISRPVRGPAYFTGAAVDVTGVAAGVNAAGGGGSLEAGSKSGCITLAATKAAAGGGG